MDAIRKIRLALLACLLICAQCLAVTPWGGLTCASLERLFYTTASQQRGALRAGDRATAMRFKNDPDFAAWMETREWPLVELALADYPGPGTEGPVPDRVVDLTNYCEQSPSPFRLALADAGADTKKVLAAVKEQRDLYRPPGAKALLDQIKARENDAASPRAAPPNAVTAVPPSLDSMLTMMLSVQFPARVPKNFRLTEYDRRVLLLRKGDRVVFGDKVFKLGEFLGAGNRTHVFAIEGEPNKVLRIPFLVEWQKGKVFHPEAGRLLGLASEKKYEHVKNRAKTLEEGPGYSVAERIPGAEDGDAFVEKVLKEAGVDPAKLRKMESGLRLFNPRESGLYAMMKSPELRKKFSDPQAPDKFQKLFRILAEMGQVHTEVLAGNRGGPPTYYIDYARQLKWDEARQDWFLIDYE